MTGTDFDPLSLPDPPPPAPAAREAVIEAALRRFDGEGTAPAKTQPPKPGRQPPSTRYHLGATLAISLVVLVIGPVAWMTATQHERAYKEAVSPKPVRQSRFEPADSLTVADTAPEAASRRAPSAKAEQVPAPRQLATAEKASPPPVIAPPPPSPSPPMAVAAPVLAVQQPGSFAKAARAENTARIASADQTAASAPAEMERRRGGGAESLGEIVVTSQRRDDGFTLVGRGDWNACTVDDPEKDIVRCGKAIGLGAKGGKGIAAAHIAEGLQAAWRGDVDKAVAAFDRAIAITPKSSFALLNRGLAWRTDGDSDRALADLNKAVQYAPGSARVWYNRALVYRDRGDQRRAHSDREQASNLDDGYKP